MTGLVLYVIVSLSPTCIYGALFRSLQLPATALLAYLALNTVCELHLLCFFLNIDILNGTKGVEGLRHLRSSKQSCENSSEMPP